MEPFNDPPAETTVITSVTFAVRVTAPLVPVMVTGYVPTAAPLVVVIASVEDPLPETDAGVNVPVTPAGSPLALSTTLLLKPFSAPIVTV